MARTELNAHIVDTFLLPPHHREYSLLFPYFVKTFFEYQHRPAYAEYHQRLSARQREDDTADAGRQQRLRYAYPAVRRFA